MQRAAPIALVLAIGCTGANPKFDEDARGPSTGSTPGDPTSLGPTSLGTVTSTFSTSNGPSAEEDTSQGVGPDPVVEFVDDAWHGEFGAAAENESMEWTDSSVQLSGSQNLGIFVSRVFDGGASRSWTSLSWTPRAAYGIALPRPSAWDAMQYPEGAIMVEELELLLHLDDGPWNNGDPVLDSAAHQRDGTWWGSPASTSPGRFRNALFNGPDGAHVNVLDPVQPGEGPFTWTLWYRGKGCTNSTFVALDPVVEEAGVTQSTFMMCAITAQCGGLGRVFVNFNASIRYCGVARIDDGAWHHIALRRRVDGSGQHTTVFVDGQPQQPVLNGAPTSSATVTDVAVHPTAQTPEEFTVAGGNEVIHPGEGEFDEVALWNRDLDDEEVQALYYRGARWARFQVRACEDPDCTDAEFVGPASDAMQAFFDPGPTAGHTIDTSDLQLVGRYVQYRFTLERDEGVPSPAIEQVRLVGVLE